MVNTKRRTIRTVTRLLNIIARTVLPSALRAVPALLAVGTILLSSSGTAWGQGDADSLKSSRLSNIDFVVTNNGIFGYDTEQHTAGFKARGADKKRYMFGSGLWFGARKIVRDRMQSLVFYTYNPFSSNSSATPGERLTSHDYGPATVYHSVEHDRFDGSAPNDTGFGPAWPLWLLPDQFYASPLSPGTFEPRLLRRTFNPYIKPAFVGEADEQFVTRYHDGDLSRYEIGMSDAIARGYPLGLQIQQNVYSWGREGLQDIIIVQYQIINTSTDTLFDCAAAQLSDPDIGENNKNDNATFYHGGEELRAAYAWSSPEGDTPLGALAIILLEAPMTRPPGWVDNSLRRNYKIQGRTGTFSTWKRRDSQIYPVTDQERYDLLTNGELDADSAEGDMHLLMASRTFDMKPGDTAHFAIAYALLDTVPSRTNGGSSHSELAKASVEPQLATLVSLIRDLYYYTGPIMSDAPEVETGGRKTSITPTPRAARP